MLKLLLKIAVTGGIASGKSTVCKYFKQSGAYVVDADFLVHKLLSTKTRIGKKIVTLLGKEIIEKGEISRKKIAKIVFDDQKKLDQLEKIIHPFIFEEIEKQYAKVQKENKWTFFVAEMPLLFETKQEKFYDYVINVKSNKIRCKQSLQKEYEKRSKKQMPVEKKMQKADFVINNNSSLLNLKTKTKKIITILKKL